MTKISAVDQPISMRPFSAVIGASRRQWSSGSTLPYPSVVVAEGEIDEVGARRRGADRRVGIGPEQDFQKMDGEEQASDGDDDDGVLQDLRRPRFPPRHAKEHLEHNPHDDGMDNEIQKACRATGQELIEHRYDTTPR